MPLCGARERLGSTRIALACPGDEDGTAADVEEMAGDDGLCRSGVCEPRAVTFPASEPVPSVRRPRLRPA
jgi:hypothetical protein